MAIPYTDKGPIPAKLVCEQWSGAFSVTFSSLNMSRNASVQVVVGGNAALITREEIAALAQLFPVQRREAYPR